MRTQREIAEDAMQAAVGALGPAEAFTLLSSALCFLALKFGLTREAFLEGMGGAYDLTQRDMSGKSH